MIWLRRRSARCVFVWLALADCDDAENDVPHDQGRGPHLDTPHAIIRMASNADVDAILEYFVRNEQFLRTYMVVDTDRKSLLRKADVNVEEFARGASCRTFLFDRDAPNKIIGAANLFSVVRGAFQACYLGYHLDESYQGKGVMQSALRSLISYAFDELRLHRIMAAYATWNERSGRVLDNLGFEHEGHAKDYLYINGKWEDHILRALTNQNWHP